MNIVPISDYCCFPKCTELAFVNRRSRHGVWFRLCEAHLSMVENVWIDE